MFVSSIFLHFLCTLFVFLHCMFEIFKIIFCMLEFFLAFFSFYKKTKNIFWFLKSFGKNNLDIFSSKLLAVHHIFKVYDRWGITWPKGGTRGPTFSNGSMTVVPGSSSGALAKFPSNRGGEGCWALSCSHTHSHSLSQSCSGYHWILAQVWLQENFLSHFFAARLSTHLEEQHSGRSFIFISLT